MLPQLYRHAWMDGEIDAFREQVRRYVAAEFTPRLDEWRRQGYIPREVWQGFGAMGFLLPEVAETWDYAELMAREKYPDLPSELFQTPQAAQIGRTMLEEGNGAITEYGLIRRTDGRPLPVFTGKPQREEFAGPQMTGM